MLKSTKFFSFLLIFFIIAALSELLFLYLHTKPATPVITTQKNTSVQPTFLPLPSIANPNGNFVSFSQIVPEGFHTISGDPTVFSFVGKITQVSTDDTGVSLIVSLGNSGEKKFIISDGNKIYLPLVQQKTYDLTPLKSERKAES